MHGHGSFWADPVHWVLIAFIIFFVIFGKKLWGALAAQLMLGLWGQLWATLGGAVAGFALMDVPLGTFLRSFGGTIHPDDIAEGLLKVLVFGLATSLLSLRAGLTAQGGAQAVGRQVADRKSTRLNSSH